MLMPASLSKPRAPQSEVMSLIKSDLRSLIQSAIWIPDNNFLKEASRIGSKAATLAQPIRPVIPGNQEYKTSPFTDNVWHALDQYDLLLLQTIVVGIQIALNEACKRLMLIKLILHLWRCSGLA